MLALALTLAATATTARAPLEIPPFRAALIVGVNAPFEASQATLRFADDDAARFAELLSPEVDRLELLTVLDAESQNIFTEAAKKASPPDRAHLLEAIATFERASKEARDAGRKTELYWIYTGHGRIRGGEGEVRLLDGAFGRSELAAKVLSSAAFDRVHLIVDACDAYHLVNARGGEAEVNLSFDRAFERFVEAGSLENFPHVGVVLSTNGPGATHEWSRYRGGVFSHEVRSAMAGAADADRDGHVDYAETGAFLASANSAVPELKGRPAVFVRAPQLERAAALFAPRAELPTLLLTPQIAGHYWIEDDRGLRYAEVHKGEGYTLALRLVPRPSYTLARRGEIAALDPQKLSPPFGWTARPDDGRSRGEDAPPGVFERPFDPSFVDGYRASLIVESTPLAEPPPALPRWTAYAAGGLSVAALGLSIWQRVEVNDAHARYRAEREVPLREAAAEDVRAHRNRSIGFAITAAVSAGLAALLYWTSE